MPKMSPDRAPPALVSGGALEALPGRLAVARVVAPYGIRGDVKAEILTDFPQRFRRLQRVFVGATDRELHLTRYRLDDDGRFVYLHFKEIPDRTAAEALRNQLLTIPEAEAMPLPEGTYYVHQIIGLRVVTDTGEELGRVREVLHTGANDVYVVDGPRGEVLLPAIPEVILDVDLAQGILRVHLLEGLVEE
jgi:16S rRNA processing protein RimM